MGAERAAKRERGAKRDVLEEFGIKAMQADMVKMATDVGRSANAVANLSDRHDGLVVKTRTSVESITANLGDLNEVRNRGLWGRLKWLLLGT